MLLWFGVAMIVVLLTCAVVAVRVLLWLVFGAFGCAVAAGGWFIFNGFLWFWWVCCVFVGLRLWMWVVLVALPGGYCFCSFTG